LFGFVKKQRGQIAYAVSKARPRAHSTTSQRPRFHVAFCFLSVEYLKFWSVLDTESG